MLFAVETGGWEAGGQQTVLVREPLVRSSVPSMVVVSKPVLANGFAPRRIFAQRAPGVVTVFSYFGAKPGGSSLEEGSGFVVDKSGVVLTSAHVIVSTSGGGLLTQPASTVYVQFGDGERVKAEVVGWDPYDDVGVLRVPPKAHALVPVPWGRLPASWSASPWRRWARPSGRRPRCRSGSSRVSGARSPR